MNAVSVMIDSCQCSDDELKQRENIYVEMIDDSTRLNGGLDDAAE